MLDAKQHNHHSRYRKDEKEKEKRERISHGQSHPDIINDKKTNLWPHNETSIDELIQ